jgi:non-specific serine/threonine protein kinase
MSPTEIASRLEDRFALLAARSRVGPERHRTLRSTIEWSHDLLDDMERRLFRRLAVFPGEFGLDAAEFICGLVDLGRDRVADLLTALVHKSLITTTVDSNDTTRLRMLDTVREFAREKLEETDEAPTLAQLHCQFFTALAETSSPHLRGKAALEWRDRLGVDLNNYRAALKWSASDDPESNARLNTHLVDLWHFVGLVEEGEGWMNQALARYTSRTEIRAELLDSAGKISFWRAERDRNSAQRMECLDIYRSLGGGAGLARALAGVGEAAQWTDDFDAAHRYFEEAIQVASRTNDEVGLETILRFMGRLAMVEGNHAKARAFLNESISINEQNGDQRSKAWSMMYLGLNSVDSGDYVAAETQLRASLSISLALDLTIVVATCLMYFAALEAALSRPVRALRLAGAATSLARSAGAAPMRLTKPVVDRWLDRARRELGPRRSERSLEEGRAMARDRAIEYASEANRRPR